MNYKAVLFDFDYTLGDATEAIVAGFTYAFREMGLPIPDRDSIRGTVGLMDSGCRKNVTGHLMNFKMW